VAYPLDATFLIVETDSGFMLIASWIGIGPHASDHKTETPVQELVGTYPTQADAETARDVLIEAAQAVEAARQELSAQAAKDEEPKAQEQAEVVAIVENGHHHQ
jgi:hypothetical protein